MKNLRKFQKNIVFPILIVLQQSNIGIGINHFIYNSHVLSCLISQLHAENESEVAQSCLTLYHPTYCSPPCSSIHGIFQARILEWVVVSFSRVYCMIVFYCSVSLPQFSLLNIFANYKRKIKKEEPTHIFSEK